MARPLAAIEAEICPLGPPDQERLLGALLEEPMAPPDPDVERAWLEAVQRRSHELDAGRVGTVPVADVLHRRVPRSSTREV